MKKKRNLLKKKRNPLPLRIILKYMKNPLLLRHRPQITMAARILRMLQMTVVALVDFQLDLFHLNLKLKKKEKTLLK